MRQIEIRQGDTNEGTYLSHHGHQFAFQSEIPKATVLALIKSGIASSHCVRMAGSFFHIIIRYIKYEPRISLFVGGCYIITTSKIISSWVQPLTKSIPMATFIVLPHLVDQIVTQFPTRSHYPDIKITRPCRILLMPHARLGSDKYQLCKSSID